MSNAEEMRNLLRIDTPTPARMYDYYLDGKDNFEVDRAAVDAMYAKVGYHAKDAAWENRKFLWRAVEHVARDQGVRQFIDVGSGLPTVRNTHEIARETDPDARVVYVDNDPIVLCHGRALLARDGSTAVVTADAREPERILSAPETTALIDFREPVAVMFVALFNFIMSPGHPRHVPGDPGPAEIVSAFADRVAPGSCLILSHASTEGLPADILKVTQDGYEQATSPVVFRPRGEIEELFEGWRLLPPGLVRAWEWPAVAGDSPRTPNLLAGVAVKDAVKDA